MSAMENMQPEISDQWQGKPISALREKEAVLDVVNDEMRAFRTAMKQQHEALDARVYNAQMAVCVEVGKLLGADPEALGLGCRKCPDSPTGQCIYDEYEDIHHDYCLICDGSSGRN